MFLLVAGVLSVVHPWRAWGVTPAAGGEVQFCQICGTTNPKGAKFCAACGQQLVNRSNIDLQVMAKQTNLFAGDTGQDEVIGGLNKGVMMRFLESGTGRFKVRLSGETFVFEGWVNKEDVSGAPAQTIQEGEAIARALSPEETSEYLHRYKRDWDRLHELRRHGHMMFAAPILHYLQAVEQEKKGSGPAKEKAKRLFQQAEGELKRQDEILQKIRTFNGVTGTK